MAAFCGGTSKSLPEKWQERATAPAIAIVIDTSADEQGPNPHSKRAFSPI